MCWCEWNIYPSPGCLPARNRHLRCASSITAAAYADDFGNRWLRMTAVVGAGIDTEGGGNWARDKDATRTYVPSL